MKRSKKLALFQEKFEYILSPECKTSIYREADVDTLKTLAALLDREFCTILTELVSFADDVRGLPSKVTLIRLKRQIQLIEDLQK